MSEQISQDRKYLYSHTSQETARLVEDYPWGFRLRTTIRYWVETKIAKNGGQRFCSQTINPKTGKWCAVKYSTYSPVIIMFLDNNGHVKGTALDHNSPHEIIFKFKETHLDNLSEYQKETLKEIIAYNEVMKHVKFEVKLSGYGMVSLLSNDPEQVQKRKQMLFESEERERREQESLNKINRAISYQISKTVL